MPANATPERRLVLKLFGAEIVDSPANEGSNGAVRLAQELAAADPRYTMLFQYANEWNPRAHYEGTGAEIVRDLPRVDALVAGPRHRRHADGHRRARARGVPGRRRRRRRAAAGRSGDGPALARGRLHAADPRRLEARPEDPRLERRVGRRGACAARPRGDLRGRLGRRGDPRRAQDRRRAARRARSSSRCSPTAAGSTCPATSGTPTTWRSRWRARSGGSPRRDPRASCTRTPPRRRRTSAAACSSSATASPSATSAAGTASPRRTATSSRSTPRCGSWRTRATSSPSSTRTPRPSRGPSRTDRELSGLWAGKPFLIYGLAFGELRAWRITRDDAEELPLD